MGIHIILRKYGGYKLEDVLKMYITQFYTLIKLINYETFLENEEHKRQQKKSKKGRR